MEIMTIKKSFTSDYFLSVKFSKLKRDEQSLISMKAGMLIYGEIRFDKSKNWLFEKYN